MNNPASRKSLKSTIDIFANLEDGWDGEGSPGPTACSVEAANAFCDAIPLGFPLPEATIGADGYVGFFWDLPSGYTDVIFDGVGFGSIFTNVMQREVFLDNLNKHTFTREWFEQNLSHLQKG